MRARHRVHEPQAPAGRASDEQIVALLRACLSARDRLIVLLMARAGLRRGELCGLRRGDVHDEHHCRRRAGRGQLLGDGGEHARRLAAPAVRRVDTEAEQSLVSERVDALGGEARVAIDGRRVRRDDGVKVLPANDCH